MQIQKINIFNNKNIQPNSIQVQKTNYVAKTDPRTRSDIISFRGEFHSNLLLKATKDLVNAAINRLDTQTKKILEDAAKAAKELSDTKNKEISLEELLKKVHGTKEVSIPQKILFGLKYTDSNPEGATLLFKYLPRDNDKNTVVIAVIHNNAPFRTITTTIEKNRINETGVENSKLLPSRDYITQDLDFAEKILIRASGVGTIEYKDPKTSIEIIRLNVRLQEYLKTLLSNQSEFVPVITPKL